MVALRAVFLALSSLSYALAVADEHPLFDSWHLETEGWVGAEVESAEALRFRIEADAFSIWHAGEDVSVRVIWTWEDVSEDDSGTLRLIFSPKENVEVSLAGSTNRLRCTAITHSETSFFISRRGPPSAPHLKFQI